jgi:hypothetical protein
MISQRSSSSPLPAAAAHAHIASRIAWATAFAALLAGAGIAAFSVPAGIALALAGLLAPDLPLIGGFAERGRLRPSRVRAYNAVHVVAGPIVLIAAGVLVPALLAAGLGWAAHVAMDRAAGYGLRGADGWQRS